jgi:hypothetical protein
MGLSHFGCDSPISTSAIYPFTTNEPAAYVVFISRWRFPLNNTAIEENLTSTVHSISLHRRVTVHAIM